MKNYSSVLIIYNPNAMKGKIEEKIPYIKGRLSVRFPIVEAMTSSDNDGANKIAYTHAKNYDIVISCGGDGTLNNVVNGVIKSKAECVIGLLPFGTCNDVARSLRIPLNLDKAIDAILRLNIDNYDIMFDGEKYITYSIASGYLTDVGYSTKTSSKRKFGRFAYFFSGLKNMFKFNAMPITITCDNEKIYDKFVYAMIINGESAGGFRLNKKDNMNDGKVKLVMIKRKNFFASFFTFLGLFIFGVKHIRKRKCVLVKDVKSVVIENHSNSPFIFDGEKTKFLRKTILVNSKLNFIKK